MKIFLAKDAGYCFGVRDAVNLAYESAEKYGDVYMLGDIVHNENVIKDFFYFHYQYSLNLDYQYLRFYILYLWKYY